MAIGTDGGGAAEAGAQDAVAADAAVPEGTVAPPADAAEGGSATDAAVAAADLAAPAEVGPADAAPVDGAPASGQVVCGEGSAIALGARIESVVVGPDGTVYYLDGSVFIGRIRPGMPDEPMWARYRGGAGSDGLAYDPKRRTLYAANRGLISMTVVPLASNGVSSGAIERHVAGGGIYGVTLGEDGTLYYLDEWNGSVYRIVPEDWSITMVATGLPNRPHGLAFGSDGWLYVTQSTGPDVWR
jgi:glucose/arabinose dehydrogenase